MADAGPRIVVSDGISYLFDQSRGKLLSISRLTLRAGSQSRVVSNQYLRVEDRQPTMSVGDVVPRNATLVGITANCETSHTWVLEIRKRGSLDPLVSLNVLTDNMAKSTALNVDINADTVLQFFVNGINVPVPRGLLEIAWRL